MKKLPVLLPAAVRADAGNRHRGILHNWGNPGGSFRSRKLMFNWDNVPMPRWAQFEVFLASAIYFSEISPEETQRVKIRERKAESINVEQSN